MPETDKLFRQQAVDAQNVMNGRVRIAPPPKWLATNLLIFGTVAGALFFASVVSYSRTIAVDGTVETDKGIPAITSQYPGILLTRVSLGDRVKEGDVIAETVLQNADERGNTALRRQKALEGEREIARLRAQSALDAGASQAAASRIRADAARGRLKTLQTQLAQAQIRTKAARDDLARAEAIAERGFLSTRDLQAKVSEVAVREQEEAVIEERMAIARGDAASASADAEQAMSLAAIDRAEALEAVSRSELSDADASASLRRIHIASSNGVIAAMPARNGQNINEGETIAVIMPDNARIVATLHVPASAMSEIRTGQTVDVAVDSYPYQTFGTIKGEIEEVSRIATEEENGSAYRVQVAIPDYVMAYGKREPILPGMSLSARITTQTRSLIQWLLDPIYAVAKR